MRADCLYVESYVATARRKNREAIAAAQRGLDELNAAGLKSGILHVTALNALARANAYAGNNAVAIGLLRQIRQAEAESGAPQTIGAWIHEFNEARDLLAGGRVLEAERLGADLQATSHGGDSASHDLTLLRGELLLALDRSAEAAQLLRQAETTTPSSTQLRRALTEVEARLRAGDATGARQLWSAWRPVAETALGAGDADTVGVLRAQALLAQAAGDRAAARELLRHAASVAVDADGSPTPQLRTIEVLQTEAALEGNVSPEAARLADAVLRRASAEAVDARSSAWVGEGLLLRARSAQARGELESTRASARTALPQLEENLGAAHPLTQLAHTLAVPQMAATATTR